MKSAPAIAFDYAPSRWLIAALASVSALALVAVALSGVPPIGKSLAAAVAGVYVAIVLRNALRPTIDRCAWHEAGQWRLRGREGDEHPATMLHATVRGPLIVLVLLAGRLRRVCIILLPDNCDADTRRRLRLRLARGTPDGAT